MGSSLARVRLPVALTECSGSRVFTIAMIQTRARKLVFAQKIRTELNEPALPFLAAQIAGAGVVNEQMCGHCRVPMPPSWVRTGRLTWRAHYNRVKLILLATIRRRLRNLGGG